MHAHHLAMIYSCHLAMCYDNYNVEYHNNVKMHNVVKI